MDNHYDAIVVGAGPAGAAAALTMAKNGLAVALLERGEYPGSKNMFGGTIYREPTELLVPEFWQEAPIERVVVSEELWLLETDSAVKVGFTGLRFGQEPYNRFAVHRSRFDRWFAGQAEAAGAVLRNNALVRELVCAPRRLGRPKAAKGVRLEGGEVLTGDVVILAEGVNANLAREAGLRKNLPPHTMTHYVREVLRLPAETIEERFNLGPGEGAVLALIGYPTAGAIGKAGIWTNRDTLSIIVGGYLDQMVAKGLSPHYLLQRVKAHPLVRRLIAGAESVEYQGHMIPKGGFRYLPKLYADGIIVAGDAATMISGRRGTDLAMLTGKYAGETVVQAKAKGDFSAAGLANYALKVDNSFFMPAIKKAKGTLAYYAEHPDADYLITSTANALAYEYFTVDMASDTEKTAKFAGIVKSKQFPLKTLEDVYQGVKHWGVF